MINVITNKMIYCGDHSEKIEEIKFLDENMTLKEVIEHFELNHPRGCNPDFLIDIKIPRQC